MSHLWSRTIVSLTQALFQKEKLCFVMVREGVYVNVVLARKVYKDTQEEA